MTPVLRKSSSRLRVRGLWLLRLTWDFRIPVCALFPVGFAIQNWTRARYLRNAGIRLCRVFHVLLQCYLATILPNAESGMSVHRVPRVEIPVSSHRPRRLVASIVATLSNL